MMNLTPKENEAQVELSTKTFAQMVANDASAKAEITKSTKSLENALFNVVDSLDDIQLG